MRVLATHSIRQFPLYFPSRVPPGSERALFNNVVLNTYVIGLRGIGIRSKRLRVWVEVTVAYFKELFHVSSWENDASYFYSPTYAISSYAFSDLRSFIKVRKCNDSIFWRRVEFFLTGVKEQWEYVAEEYCWVITHVAGRSCWGWSCCIVLESGFQLDSFLGTFAKLRKVTIKLVMSLRSSVRSHGTTRLPTGRFSRKLIFEYFLNICWENSSFIKIGQKNGHFTWRPIYIFYHISLNSS